MAIDRDRAFEDDDGFIPGEGAPHFVGGIDLPENVIPSPTGPTVYLRANGEIWYSPTGGPWAKRPGTDHHCFFQHVGSGVDVLIDQDKQSVVFGVLDLEGVLCIEGTLISEP